MEPQLAYLGMGNIGRNMTTNLVNKGKLENPIILWNRTHHRAADLSAEIGHSRAVHTIEEAIEPSDIIWTCLADQEAVLEAFDIILKGDIRGKLFLECSTMTPPVTNDLAKRVIDAGAEFVAMPVFGDPSLAKRGLLTCIPAGAPQSVDRARRYLVGVVCRAVVDFSSEEPGKASLVKNIGNVILFTTMETVAECHVFAEKSGLGVGNMQKLLEALLPTGPALIYSRGMMSGSYHHETKIVHIESARKLASHVLRQAEECGTSLPSYKVAVEHLAVAEKHVGPAGDVLGIYGAVRVESGLPYANNDIVREA